MADLRDRGRAALERLLGSYVTFVVIGLLIGAMVAPVAHDATTGPDATVAVIPIEGSIDGQSVARATAALSEARRDDSVKAVVLVVNSGGGTAAASEELYMQVKRTAQEKPVVAAVDAAAASGAYYGIAPADRIYAKPSSIVGSIGVLAPLPPEVEPNDIIGATGPNKLAGADEREFHTQLERLQEAFLGAVMAHRGDELELAREDLAEARIYVGAQAVENGLVDALGDREAAVRDAAARADLSEYRVRVIRAGNEPVRFVSRSAYLASAAPEKRMVSPQLYVDEQGTTPLFLMMPASYVEAEVTNATG